MKLKVNLNPSIKKLEIASRGLVNTRMIGRYKSVFRGKGLEFEDFRPYAQDDDASLIDWKASTRGNGLLIKEFSEERNMNVFFLIDASSTMVFGSTEKLKNEYAAELASSLCFAILQAGDNVGFAMFNSKVINKVPPGRGFKVFYTFSKELVDASNYGGNYDLAEALKFTLSFLKGTTVLIILSDFIGLKGDWKKYLKIVSTKYSVIGIMIRDPRDKILPEDSAQFIVEDPYTGKQILVSPSKIRAKYRSYVESSERMIEESFRSAHADFVSITTDKPYLKPIMDLFNRRAKR